MTEIERLRMENERLSVSRADCKQELGELTNLAQKWRIRSYVAEKLLGYLNKLNPFWFPADLKKEIDIHVDRLFEKWKRGEPSLKEDEALWRCQP